MAVKKYEFYLCKSVWLWDILYLQMPLFDYGVSFR